MEMENSITAKKFDILQPYSDTYFTIYYSTSYFWMDFLIGKMIKISISEMSIPYVGAINVFVDFFLLKLINYVWVDCWKSIKMLFNAIFVNIEPINNAKVRTLLGKFGGLVD